ARKHVSRSSGEPKAGAPALAESTQVRLVNGEALCEPSCVSILSAMRHPLILGLVVGSCFSGYAGAAEIGARATAGAQLAMGNKPRCKENSDRKCIPADVVTYAPLNLRI